MNTFFTSRCRGLLRLECETRNDKFLGFGMVEIIVAVGLWAILGGSGMILVLGSLRTNRLADESVNAAHLAAEGVDAVDAIKKQGWTTPLLATNCTGGCGLATVSGTWAFSGSNNVLGKYTRQVFVNPVNRDVSNNIVSSGGSVDADTYKLESRVSWSRGTPPITNTTSVFTYLTNYAKAIGKKGIFVYGDGGTTSDAIKYKTYDGTTWGAATATADVDGATTNKYLRIARLYASATRNEKVLISRHYNGTGQWVYAQVFDGTNWGNVVQLSTWNAVTFLDVQNFGGAYLANGDFVVVYSDNTTTPKSRVWNGTTWAAQTSLNVLSGTPIHIVLKARDTSNEMMAAFLNSASDTQTEYNNGAGYATANWAVAVTHAANTVLNTKRIVDFLWSRNSPLQGMLVYAAATTAKIYSGKIWLANGSGSGAWTAAAVTSVAQTNNLGGLRIADRVGANEFQVCNKDAGATPTIVCRKATFTSGATTMAWVTPTNPIIAAATDTGIQASFDEEYELATGTMGINVYGDNTTTPKYKKYTASTSTWDAAATNMGVTAGAVKTVRLIQTPASDDMLAFVTDANLDVYSYVWDGTGNAMSASTLHGANGSAITDYWYDFVWDGF